MTKLTLLLFSISMMFLFPIRIKADEIKEDDLYARYACLMDADSGRILFEKNAYEKKPNASTTKILTCILALEMGNLEDVVTVSKRAADQPKVHLGAKVGEEFLLQDLLYSLMLESHNDSAVMIAEHVGGSVEEFADLMNQKAISIGCKDTYFITPNGLDDQNKEGIHGTTAADLALIMRYCIMESPKKEQFLEITKTSAYSFWNREETILYNCHNHNAFLAMMQGALTGKTGFTADAGYCYIGALERDGKKLIVSLLACGWPNQKNYKWEDTKKLMNYGIEEYQLKDVLDKNLPVNILPVDEGQKQYVYLTYAENLEQESLIVLMKDSEQIQKVISLPDVLTAPVNRGMEIGEVTYKLGEDILKTYPIYTKDSVKKIDFIWCFDIIKQKYCMKNGG